MAAEGRSAVELELGIDVTRAQGELRELASTFAQSFSEISAAGSEAGRGTTGRVVTEGAATETAHGRDDVEDLRRRLLAGVKQVSEQAGRILPVVKPGTPEDIGRGLQSDIDRIKTEFIGNLKKAVSEVARGQLGLSDVEISRLQREANIGSRVSNTYRRTQAAVLTPREEREREEVLPTAQARETSRRRVVTPSVGTPTTEPVERPETPPSVAAPVKKQAPRVATTPAEQVSQPETGRATPPVPFNKGLSDSEAEALKTQLANRDIASGGVLEGGLPLPPRTTEAPASATKQEKERRETTQAAAEAATTAITRKPPTEKPQKVQVTQTPGQPIATAPTETGAAKSEPVSHAVDRVGEHVERAVAEARRERRREGAREPGREPVEPVAQTTRRQSAGREEAFNDLKQRLAAANRQLAESTELTAQQMRRAGTAIGSAARAIGDHNLNLATKRVENAEGLVIPPARREQQLDSLIERIQNVQLTQNHGDLGAGAQNRADTAIDKALSLIGFKNVPAATRQVEAAERAVGIVPVSRPAVPVKVPEPVVAPVTKQAPERVVPAVARPVETTVPTVEPTKAAEPVQVAQPVKVPTKEVGAVVEVPPVEQGVNRKVAKRADAPVEVPTTAQQVDHKVAKKAAPPLEVPVTEQQVDYKIAKRGTATEVPAIDQQVSKKVAKQPAPTVEIPAITQQTNKKVAKQAAAPVEIAPTTQQVDKRVAQQGTASEVPAVEQQVDKKVAKKAATPVEVPSTQQQVDHKVAKRAAAPVEIPATEQQVQRAEPTKAGTATKVPVVNQEVYGAEPEKAGTPTKVAAAKQDILLVAPERAPAAKKVGYAQEEVAREVPEKAPAAKKVPVVTQEVQRTEPEEAGPAKKIGHRHQRVQKAEPEPAGEPRKVAAAKQAVQLVETGKARPPIEIAPAKQQVDKVVAKQAAPVEEVPTINQRVNRKVAKQPGPTVEVPVVEQQVSKKVAKQALPPVTPEQQVEVNQRIVDEQNQQRRRQQRNQNRVQTPVVATEPPAPAPPVAPAGGGGGRPPRRPPTGTPPSEEPPLIPGGVPEEQRAQGRAAQESAVGTAAAITELERIQSVLGETANRIRALFSREGPTGGALVGPAAETANAARLSAGLVEVKNARAQAAEGTPVEISPNAQAVEALQNELGKLQARIAAFEITTQPHREAFSLGNLLGLSEVHLGTIAANPILKSTLGIPGGLIDIRGQAASAARETRQTTEILSARRTLGETNPERLAGKDLEGKTPEQIAQIHELTQQTTRATTQAGARLAIVAAAQQAPTGQTSQEIGILALNRALQQEIAARTAAAAAEISNIEFLAAASAVQRQFNDDLRTATARLTDIGKAGANLAARQNVTAAVQTQAEPQRDVEQLVALAAARAGTRTAVTQGLANQGLNRQGETVTGEGVRRAVDDLRRTNVQRVRDSVKDFLGIGKEPPKPPPTNTELVQEALSKRAQKATVAVGVEQGVREGVDFTQTNRQAEALASVLKALNTEELKQLQNATAINVTGRRPSVFQALRYYSRGGGNGGGSGEGGALGSLGEPNPGSFFLRHATNLLGYAIPGIAFGVVFEGLRTALEDAAETQKTLAEIQAEFSALGQSNQFQGYATAIQSIAVNTGVAVNEVAELALAFKGVFSSTQQATQAIQAAAEGVQALGVPVAQLQEDLTGISQAFDSLREAGGSSIQTIENQALHLQDIFGVPAKQTLAGTADIAAIAQQQGLKFPFTAGLVAATAQRTGLSGTDIGEAFARVLPGFTTNLGPLLEQVLPLGRVAQPFANAVQAGNNQQALIDFFQLFSKLGSGAQYSLIQTLGGNPSSRATFLAASQALQNPQVIRNIESPAPANRLQEEFNKQISTVAGRMEQLDNAIQQLFVNILNSGAGSALAQFINYIRQGTQFLVTLNNALHGLPVEVAATILAFKVIGGAFKTVQGVRNIVTGKAGTLNAGPFNEQVVSAARQVATILNEGATKAADTLATGGKAGGAAEAAGGETGGTAEAAGGRAGGAAEAAGGLRGGEAETAGGLGGLGKAGAGAGVVAGAGEAEGAAGLLATGLNVALIAAIAYEVVQAVESKITQHPAVARVQNAIFHPPGQGAESRFVNNLNLNSLILPPGSTGPTNAGEAAYNQYLKELAGSSQQFKVQAQERVNAILQDSGVVPHAVNQPITRAQGLRVGGEFGPGFAQALRAVEEGIKRSGKVEAPELVDALNRLTTLMQQSNLKLQQYGGYPFITPPRIPARELIQTQQPESANAAAGPTLLPGAAALGPQSINALPISAVGNLKIPPFFDFTGVQTAYEESGASFQKLVQAAQVQVQATKIAFQSANGQQQPAAFEAYQTAISNLKQVYDTQAQVVAQFASQFLQQGSPTGALDQLAISFQQLAHTQSITGIQQAISGMVQAGQAFTQSSASFALSTGAANQIMQQGFTFTKAETQQAIASLEAYNLSYNQAVKLLSGLGVHFTAGGLLKVPGAVVTPQQQFTALQEQVQAQQQAQVAQAFENQPQIAQINVQAAQKLLAFYQAEAKKGVPGAALQVKSYQAQLTTAVNTRTDTANQIQQAQAQLQAAVVGENPVAAAQAQAHEGQIALALARAHHNDPAALAQAQTQIVTANEQLAIALNAITQAQAGFYQAVFTGAPVQAAQASIQQGQAALSLATQQKNRAAQFAALQQIASAQYQRAQAVVQVTQAQAQLPVSVAGLTGGAVAAQASLTQAQTVLQTTVQQQTQLYNKSPQLQAQFPTAAKYLAQNSDVLNAQSQALSALVARPAAIAQQVQSLGAAGVAAASGTNPLVQASAQLNLDLNSYSTLITQLQQLWQGPQHTALQKLYGTFSNLVQIAGASGLQSLINDIVSKENAAIQATQVQVQTPVAKAAIVGGLPQAIATQTGAFTVLGKSIQATIQAANAEYTKFQNAGDIGANGTRGLTRQQFVSQQVSQSNQSGQIATARQAYLQALGATIQSSAAHIQALGGVSVALQNNINPVVGAAAQLNVDLQTQNDTIDRLTQIYQAQTPAWRKQHGSLSAYLQTSDQLNSERSATYGQEATLFQNQTQQVQILGSLQQAQLALRGQPIVSSLAGVQNAEQQVNVAIQQAAVLWSQLTQSQKKQYGSLQNFTAQTQGFITSQTNVATAQGAYQQAIVSQTQNVVESELTLGQITVQQGIAQLYAALSKVKGNQQATLQIETEIRQLQNSAGQNLSFNLPTTLIPSTLYAARLAEATGGAFGPIGQQTNNVQININGGSSTSIQQGLQKFMQVLGAPTTSLPNAGLPRG